MNLLRNLGSPGVLLLVFLSGATSSCAPGEPPARSERPNILFVFADDHAYQAIGAYGSAINRTPNIDRLAEGGMRFDRAVVTNSICAPARAVIQTGRYSHLNGVRDNSHVFDGGQVTFPKLLREAGYQTAMIGKWHLKSAPTGFDHWEVLPGQGAYYNPDLLYPDADTTAMQRREGYVTDIVTDLALEWLAEGRDAGQPFLLMVQHKAPHRSWMPGPDHLATFENVTIPEPETLFDDYAGRASPAANQEMTIARHMFDVYDLKLEPLPGTDLPEWQASAFERMSAEQKTAWDAAYGPRNEAFRAHEPEGDDLTRWKYQRYIKDYLRTIASIDDNLGRILDWLDETGLSENTVVVYTSDQGFYLGEHGWYDKRWMYEESFRTPLVVRWPGQTEPGSSSGAIVSNLDFAPTFLELAGLAAPSHMQGQSMVPLLEGQTPPDWRSSFYYHYYEADGPHAVAEHYGVATDRYKLIRYPATDEWELFDLETDPHELMSRAEDPAYAGIRLELEAELERLREDLEVPAE
ncbi:MAG: sulfatase [marine benthic group bacterium]|nr:sulfatase [Gemmatimonadota bacterium]